MWFTQLCTHSIEMQLHLSSCFFAPHCKAPLKLMCWHQQPPSTLTQALKQSLAHSANPSQRETTHTHTAAGLWTQTCTRNTCLHMDMKTHAHQAWLHGGWVYNASLAHPGNHLPQNQPLGTATFTLFHTHTHTHTVIFTQFNCEMS